MLITLIPEVVIDFANHILVKQENVSLVTYNSKVYSLLCVYTLSQTDWGKK